MPRPHRQSTGSMGIPLEEASKTEVKHKQVASYVQYDPSGFNNFMVKSTKTLVKKAPPSRSPSVHRLGAASNDIKDEEDISAVMMRGATDLRNTKMEVEELRREVSFLQEQLETAQRDKEECLQRIKVVKDATKHSLESSARSLESLKAAMDDLKAESQESFGPARQTQECLSDIVELRGTVTESLNSSVQHTLHVGTTLMNGFAAAIQPLLDDNGELLKAGEAREILSRLQAECQQSQQVSEILRERLQAVGAELIDAKARVSELENMQVADREALRNSTQGLSSTTEQVNELAQQLKEHQGRMYEVLSTAADAQAELAATKEEITRLHGDVIAKSTEIDHLRNDQSEMYKLRATLQERDASILSLQSVKEELDISSKQINEKLVQISGYEADMRARNDLISELTFRIRELEDTNRSQMEHHGELQERLGAAQAREDLEGKKLQQTEEDLKTAKAKAEMLEAGLQERTLESETGKLKCDVAVLDQQNATLQEKIADLQAAVAEAKQAATADKAEHDAKLRQHDDAHRGVLERELERIKDVEAELHNARSGEQTLTVQVLDLTNQVQDFKTQLRDTECSASETQTRADCELADLRSQVVQLQAENAELLGRSKTLEPRYRAGDLDVEERTFINDLIKTTQSIHEQELVTKGNDLRRRDNTILELRSKISILESTLSKHLKSQAKIQASSGVENRSLIDPATWASSDRSSPPVGPPVLRVGPPERRLSNSYLAVKTPAVPRRPQAPAIVIPSVQATPLPTRTPAISRPPLALKSAMGPSNARDDNPVKTNKPKFGKLARSSSDLSESEDSDPPGCKDRSPVKLGKRHDRPEAPFLDEEVPPRPVIRRRYGTRSRAETKQSEESIPKAAKALEIPAAKRTRRQR
ncbi:hypothetical protein EUX98_g1277 [Antrodiella citrinella]|uniref:Uncharacterized protein n=1 Tax=Antrodiella citrinella TaxID=2447956 RepID=A0A4S4N1X4_9APHY|nr:hypothetical protein EUX98_g1277 [Antrodiella citrinella]